MAILSVLEVREFLSDYAINNHLLDGEEMSDTYLSLCITLAVDEYNTMTPISNYDTNNFPSKSVLLYGTLWKAYDGKAALLARNTMAYSDGGLQIPIEERSELYMSLANKYMGQFMSAAQKLKIQINMESGWGELRSDEAFHPLW